MVEAINEYLQQLKNLSLSIFENEPVKIILFGSRARGDQNPTSDVDIGIIPRSGSCAKATTLLKEKIEESNIPFKVDVVNLKETSEDFYNEAIKDAVVWKD